MCGSSQSYNFPQQPTYGEGMADAMKAQMEQLLGQGDFADIYADAGFAGGNLADIIREVEAPLRQQTAQTDTDVLRQTLLGNRTESTSGTYDDEGRLVVGYEGGQEATTVTKNVKPDVEFVEVRKAVIPGIRSNAKRKPAIYKITFKDPNTGTVIQEGFTQFSGREQEKEMVRSGTSNGKPISLGLAPSIDMAADVPLNFNNSAGIGAAGQKSLNYFAKLGLTPVDLSNSGKLEATISTPPKDAVPVYGKDPNGNIIVDKSKAGQTETIPASFSGDGMINLLGDSRNVQEFTTRGATQDDVAAGLASEVGESITVPTGNRKAGFDADGNFLGLSAFSEDLARGNLSRQREADLADVERLSDRYRGVMEDYKPAATSGVDGARELLEEQKEKLTEGGGVITKPEGSTFASGLEGQTMTAAKVGQGPTLDAQTSYNPSASVSGGTFDADTSYTASQVADPLRLQAATSYDPSASVEGRGYTATAGVEGGNIGADTLRAALLADAESALGQGLTEREQAQIANSARARQTLMGRTFDQAGAIEEAQALIAEDNNRRMQNRGFAQSALGQEADIQRDDLGRGLQAQLQNQAAKNQAAQFGASQDMQAQLANQAATNQAAQAGLQAGLSQEALAAQQAQAKAMADASAANQASQFGVSAGLQQESQANQAALQAQLANQAATNQARAAGLQAGLSQDAQQAQLDQASNLAQAELTQQANAFGAQSAQQAALANQAQQQQANQFAVGATMDAERIDESLRQQGLGNYINAVGNLAQIEDKFMLDPFQALLGRGGGGSLQSGQSVFGQAGYGLNSGPQYLNPEAGLGYISNMAANQANMYGAQLAADASRSAGLMGGLGAIGGGLLQGAGAAASGGTSLLAGLCWVAREVYGPANPAWMQFREWMYTESPQWFFELYRKYGERFASWISDKPRLKGIIRKWMDSKIGDK
jgi:hypothetical protein